MWTLQKTTPQKWFQGKWLNFTGKKCNKIMTVENSSKGEMAENAFKEDTAIKTINTVH